MTISSTKQQVLPADMRRLLLEIGLMGFGGGFAYEAEVFFQKLRIVDPTAAYPLIALAQIYFFTGDPLQAEQLLLELVLGPHGSNPVVCEWVQDTRRMGIDCSRAHAAENQKIRIR
jgi:hypothetical protein